MAFVSLSALGFAQNSPYIKAVDEYVPAPGQFVNELPKLSENDTPETAAQACKRRPLSTIIASSCLTFGIGIFSPLQLKNDSIKTPLELVQTSIK